MENTENNLQNGQSAVISPQERQEFEEFKRQKRVAEARAIIAKLELTFTQATAERAALRRAAKDGEKLGLGGICVNPCQVKACSEFLGAGSPVAVVACISPWGGTDTTDIKIKQVKRALRDGAKIVEVTVPVPAIKEGDWAYVRRELKKLRSAARKATLRVNLEAPLLNAQELTKLCALICELGITAVRTAGEAFGSGADEEELKLIKTALKDKAIIKADGADAPGRLATLFECGASLAGSASAIAMAQTILSVAEK